ncbi:MAG TPA: serine/threonine protein kinase [Planctomycetaceae bacterium]|nr:serine/threonine protein kinase [Planctomycetaceae bacterium]
MTRVSSGLQLLILFLSRVKNSCNCMNPLINQCAYFVCLLSGCWPALLTQARADWPFVRGNIHANGVADSGLPDEPELIWGFSVPDSGFEATAVIVDGVIYVGDIDSTFYAIRLVDGQLVWKQTFKDSGFSTAAAVVNQRVFVGDFEGVVRCLRTDSGKEIWSYESDSELYAAPNVYDGCVLVTTESGKLLVLDAQTGDLKWHFQIEAPLRCWPAVIEGRVFLAGCDERLHAIDIETEKEVEDFAIDGPTGSTPASWGKNVYFGTETGTFYAITTSPLQKSWSQQDFQRAQPIRVAAAVDRRAVIYGGQGKRMVALNPMNGEQLWEFPLRSRTEGAPVISGERVVFATVRGRVYAIDIKNGAKKWEYEAGGSFQASPAVVDRKLVIGNTNGLLYCFGEKKDAAGEGHR